MLARRWVRSLDLHRVVSLDPHPGLSCVLASTEIPSCEAAYGAAAVAHETRPLACSAVRSDGSIAWQLEGVNAREVRSDGCVVGQRADGAPVLIDAAGRVLETEPPAACGVPARRGRILWAAGRGWMIDNLQFTMLTADGAVARGVPLPWGLLEARYRECLANDPGLGDPAGSVTVRMDPGTGEVSVSDRAPSIRPIPSWKLTYDPRHELVLATAERPAWVLAFSLTGDLVWATVASLGCCTYPCVLAGEGRIAQGCSCGRAVTLFSHRGEVVARYRAAAPLSAGMVADEAGRVWTTSGNQVLAVSQDGSLAYAHDIDPLNRVQRLAAVGKNVYAAVSGNRHALQLMCFGIEV